MIANEDLSGARYEIKFSAVASQYASAINWIDSHSCLFTRAYEPRVVNNIYFDNEELDAYRENLSGISSRSKMRLRWYGDTANPRNCSLELKLKRNMLGWKVSDKIAFDENFLSQMMWTEVRSLLRERASDSLRFFYESSESPVIINRYLRDYFVSADEAVRITVDRGVRFFDQRSSSRMNLSFESVSPDIVIIEAKFSANNLDLGQRMLSGIPFRRTKSSKYVIGVTSILGY